MDTQTEHGQVVTAAGRATTGSATRAMTARAKQHPKHRECAHDPVIVCARANACAPALWGGSASIVVTEVLGRKR